MTAAKLTSRLAQQSPQLEHALTSTAVSLEPRYADSEVRRETLWVAMRDGVRLATDLYLPPRLPAPAVAMRTPYGRANSKMRCTILAMARQGYVVITQDCRGTGDSEPDRWDYYVYEPEDGVDLVEWVTGQSWYDGFLGAFGSSYVAQTQWGMALHPCMSAIVPEVSGLGVAPRTARKYMFYNAYARSVGKGANKLPMGFDELERHMLSETLAGGYFNEPIQPPLPEAVLRRYPDLRERSLAAARATLWDRYCEFSSAARAELVKLALGVSEITLLEIEALTAVFGLHIPHDAYTVPRPQRADVCRALHAPALMITGWYDWSLHDALATWDLLVRSAQDRVRALSRLIITPSAHNTPGYHERAEAHPELQHSHRVPDHAELLLRWYEAVRSQTVDEWPRVIYYLMGANEWHVASGWPPPEACSLKLFLCPNGKLGASPEPQAASSQYHYDPDDPTPTVGGSIVSYVYPPGSVDVAAVQARHDVVSFSTSPLNKDLDVVGPLRLILYASSSAVDTDFVARLSDVHPDGRVLQLQNGVLRARYRSANGEAQLLEPGRIYRFEIDLWATANRFRVGHRLRVDISSADFPRFDRNTNRGGEAGVPIRAEQTLYHDREYPSHLLLQVLNG